MDGRAAAALAVITAVLIGLSPPLSEAGVGSSPAGSPASMIGIRLVDAPTQRRDDPRAQLYVVDHIAPGSTIRRRVEVSNMASTRHQISLYPAAAKPRDGTFTVADGRTGNELTSWVSLDQTTVDLAAGARHLVTMTIMVPSTASSGERYGVVWAELASPSPDGSGVTVVNRVGIRIYLSVGPGGEPASDFRIESLTATRTVEGQPIVTAQVRNTGERALDLSGQLQLTDGPGSLAAGPFPIELGTTLAIGAVGPIVVRLDKGLPDGPWRAHLELQSGSTQRVADATLLFASVGSAQAVTPERPTRGPALTVLALAMLVGLALAGIPLTLRNRRRRRTTQ